MKSLVGVLAAVTLVVTACSDSGTSTSSSTSTPGGLVVSLTEFRFAPATVTVAAGGEAMLILQNDGATDHDWVVLSSPITAEDEFSENLVLARALVRPGERRGFTFVTPAAGEYQVICSISGHFASGMEGQLVVEG